MTASSDLTDGGHAARPIAKRRDAAPAKKSASVTKASYAELDISD